jgi:hypothetical protein
MPGESIPVEKVFVAGAFPQLTYNRRDNTENETEVRTYLRQPGKCLMVSGPSKMGKTVLIEHFVERSEAVWLSGNSVPNVDAFWQKIVDQLDAYITVEQSYSTEEGAEAGASLSVGSPGLLAGRAAIGGSGRRGESYGGSTSRSAESVVLETMRRSPVRIVIDDFHYIPVSARESVAFAVKQLILHTQVILISVRHEAFEIVANSDEMGGRVWNVTVPEWETGELAQIAVDGFEQLGLTDPDNIGQTLAQASLNAPFLMQQLCLDLLIEQGIDHSKAETQAVVPPQDWKKFFRRIANRHEPSVFAALKSGPPVRGEPRRAHRLRSGAETDVYGAVLLGLARSGRREMHYLDVAAAIAPLIEGTISNSRIGSTLTHMSTLAERSRGRGDPALAYKDDVVTIVDPFLAFYLQHGDWEPPVARQRTN